MSICSVMADEAPYRHIVLFKFKGDAPTAAVTKVAADFAALKGKIDLIQDFEWGTNVSPEAKANGFTHCFVATFKSKAELEKYLVHPAHKTFSASLAGLVDKAMVIDYVAKRGQ